MGEAAGNDSLKESVVLLFSGGLDTTLEAAARLEEYRKVHLLTFDNGCCVNVGGGRRRAEELARHFDSSRIVHTVADTGPLMQSILAEQRSRESSLHSPLIFDLACKMSALTELVWYAKTSGVTDISDGAAVEQTQIFLQHPDFTSHIKPLIDEYGLTWVPPVQFDMDRKSKLALLKEQGFNSGAAFLEKIHITSQIRHQPFCLRGFVTYFFTSPLRHLGPVKKRSLSVAEAKKLWDELLPVARKNLDERLLSAGVKG